jgi:hypothetical protein
MIVAFGKSVHDTRTGDDSQGKLGVGGVASKPENL